MIAAPASAASMLLRAICSGVIGRYGDMLGVAIAPVIAQLMMTLAMRPPSFPQSCTAREGATRSGPRFGDFAYSPFPTTTWSCSVIASAAAAAATSRVIAMSSRDGSGSPLGWLCARITAVACSSSARFTTSRG